MSVIQSESIFWWIKLILMLPHKLFLLEQSHINCFFAQMLMQRKCETDGFFLLAFVYRDIFYIFCLNQSWPARNLAQSLTFPRDIYKEFFPFGYYWRGFTLFAGKKSNFLERKELCFLHKTINLVDKKNIQAIFRLMHICKYILNNYRVSQEQLYFFKSHCSYKNDPILKIYSLFFSKTFMILKSIFLML